jgi:aminotransferase
MARDYVSARVNSIPPSGIRKFFDIAATMKEVISLGIGEPDFTTPDPIIKAGIASLQHGDTHYTSNSGTVELRKSLNGYLQRRYGLEYDPETELLITVGVSEALYLALTAILDPGDEVIVPQPCFVAYTAEVTLAGGVPVPIATRVENNFMVTREEIATKITPHTKAILIGYPNNPTGAVMTRERLLDIAQLAEQHDLIILSDEIYDRLVYASMAGGAAAAHTCFPTLPGMRERTILLGGFSKSHAMTGWRIGYSAAPQEISAAMRKIHQFTIMSAPTMAQVAAIEAIEQGEDFVEQMRQEYDRRRRLIVSGFNSFGMKTFEPQGAFYAFPSVAISGMNEDEFANRLLQEEHVAVVPGTAFGAGGEGYVRCSYATAYEKIEEALRRMERFVRRHG